MADLQAALERFREFEGVEHLLLIGQDGLLIHHSGGDGVDAETIAALSPAVASACIAFGDAAAHGAFATAVIEWERGVGVVATVSPELLLAVLLRAGVGFAPLLRAIRTNRGELAALA